MDSERKTIFLVDDDMTCLTLGKKALADSYNVFAISVGTVLFEMLESKLPDLILLDINMPVMDGYEIIKLLKSNENTVHIPVIFLTVHNDEEMELKGLSMGAIDYITKPFSAPLLLKRIEVHLLVEAQKRELIRVNNRLEQMVKAREDLVRTFSHEIRTPLSVMSAYTEIAVEQFQKGNINERTISGLAVISDEALRLGELAGEMLVRLKVKGENAESQTVMPINITRIAEQLTRLIEPSVTALGREIQFNIDRHLIASCEANEITQVLWNLLDNAVKHARHGNIIIDGNANDEYVYIIIADEGQGIPAEILHQILERGISGGGGSGLGLSISDEIVKKHGGKLLIESEFGYGAMVTMLLPAHKTRGGVNEE